MKNIKKIISNEAFIILACLCYLASLATMACIYNNIAFLGCGVIIAFVAGCILASYSNDDQGETI